MRFSEEIAHAPGLNYVQGE